MPLPEMQSPPSDEPYQQTEYVYHDGSRRNIFWTEIEAPYPDGRLIVSRTDREGFITHANDAFVQMSGGYSLEELIGAPHHLLRHPDMPSAVFKELWDDCTNRRKWHGYVKNLRKDGAYYWVYATVVPNVRNGRVVGYTSVRRKPSRTKINELIPVYQQQLAQERANSAGRNDGQDTLWKETVVIQRTGL